VDDEELGNFGDTRELLDIDPLRSRKVVPLRQHSPIANAEVAELSRRSDVRIAELEVQGVLLRAETGGDQLRQLATGDCRLAGDANNIAGKPDGYRDCPPVDGFVAPQSEWRKVAKLFVLKQHCSYHLQQTRGVLLLVSPEALEPVQVVTKEGDVLVDGCAAVCLQKELQRVVSNRLLVRLREDPNNEVEVLESGVDDADGRPTLGVLSVPLFDGARENRLANRVALRDRDRRKVERAESLEKARGDFGVQELGRKGLTSPATTISRYVLNSQIPVG
jgi:hypothetical protein